MADPHDTSVRVRGPCAAPAALLHPALVRGTQHRAPSPSLHPLAGRWGFPSGHIEGITLGTPRGYRTAAPSHSSAGPAHAAAESLARTRGLRRCRGRAGLRPQGLALPGRRSGPCPGQSAGLSLGKVLPGPCPRRAPLTGCWRRSDARARPLPALPPQPRAPQGYPSARAALR